MPQQTEQLDRVRTFRELHEHILLVPNAWDPPSARAIEAAGAAAVATTSAGVAWALGRHDGRPAPEGLDKQSALAAAARIARCVALPVSIDLEAGYADTPEAVASTVSEAVALGIAGINLEDSRGAQLLGIGEQRAVLEAAAGAVTDSGVPVFVNARTDVFLLDESDGSQPDLLDEVIARGRMYASAGADGLFVPGLTDLDMIARLVQEVPVPINIMVGAGPVAVNDLAAAGVRRVTWGPTLTIGTYGWLTSAVTSVLDDASQEGFPEGASGLALAP